MSIWTLSGIFVGSSIFFLILGNIFGRRRKLLQDPKRDIELLLFRVLVGMTLAIAVAVTGAVIWFSVVDWPTDPIKTAEFGQRGDFFGGFVNPFLTFIAFVGFLYTVMLQRQEIKDGRDQAAKAATVADQQNESVREQNYQAAFFQMLGA